MAGQDITPYGRIYCITNEVNGKRYVGQTTRTIDLRWTQHRLLQGKCRALESAIKKYGAESFSILEIAAADSQNALDALEVDWIERLSTVSPSGYNLSSGGAGAGRMHDDTKAIIRGLAKSPDRMAAFNDMRTRPDVRQKWLQTIRKNFSDPGYRAAALEKLKAGRTPESESRRREASAKTTSSSQYRQAQSKRMKVAQNMPGVKAKRSESLRAHWSGLDDDRRAEIGAAISRGTRGIRKTIDRSPEAHASRSAAGKKSWESAGRRSAFAEQMANLHADPGFLKRRGDAIRAGKARRKAERERERDLAAI